MLEIMGKILLCLVVAVVLGFLVGWLFSRALTSEKHDVGEHGSSKSDNELNKSIEALEQKYEEEKKLSADYAEKNRELKGELMKKISILKSTSDRLKQMQGYDKDRDRDGNGKVAEVEKRLKEKEVELMEFETVLVKAEETIAKLSHQLKSKQ